MIIGILGLLVIWIAALVVATNTFNKTERPTEWALRTAEIEEETRTRN